MRVPDVNTTSCLKADGRNWLTNSLSVFEVILNMIVLSATQVLLIMNISQRSGTGNPRVPGEESSVSWEGCSFVLLAVAHSSGGTAPRAAAVASAASVDGCWWMGAGDFFSPFSLFFSYRHFAWCDPETCGIRLFIREG